MEKALSLQELNGLVRKSIKSCLPDSYWLQAELSEVHANYSGHCYVEFVQKEERGNQLIAKARGTIWRNVFQLLKPYFEEATGQSFGAGIKVLVKVAVEFHELYGFSLVVQDIDPTYTLGDLARRRREILKQLEEEGILTLNKELTLPILPQRIAVISSATAAGYGDFSDQLQNNPFGFVFYPKLFPAIMQGERLEESIIAALNRIYATQEEWDAVVIIRGGGSTSDLSGFDTYALAANCAQFPIPILTGIGHERDDTVIDSVAHTRVKTPTAAAELLIERIRTAAARLDEQVERLMGTIEDRMSHEKRKIERMMERMPLQVKLYLQQETHQLSALQNQLTIMIKKGVVEEKHRFATIQNQLGAALQKRTTQESHQLQLMEQQLKAASPALILEKGYTLTLHNGNVVTQASQLKEGERVTTRFSQGEITSIVTTK
ncbi:MAG: exodeoxyribonuclease VII large subunit [Phocaeicola sp.]